MAQEKSVMFENYTKFLQDRLQLATMELFRTKAIEVCGERIGPVVADYLTAYWDFIREAGKEKETLDEERERLAKILTQYQGIPLVAKCWLFVGEVQARIAAGALDPQPDYK